MNRKNAIIIRDTIYTAIHNYQLIGGTIEDIEAAVKTCLPLFGEGLQPAAEWLDGWLTDGGRDSDRYQQIFAWYFGFSGALRLALGWL